MNMNSALPFEQTFSSLSSVRTILHNYQDLIVCFNATFTNTENTVLVKGDHEPIYIPAKSSHQHHQIVFAHGYFASALHEISHWCIAGKQRRLLEDYGYWYCPDGRDVKQQTEFEKVEVKPQAIEWAFSCASGKPFAVSTDNLNGAADVKQQTEFEKVEVKPQAIEWAFSCASGKPFAVSTDNLNGAAGDTQGFQDAVKQQVMFYLKHGFPPRAAEFIGVLHSFYKTDNLHREMFDVESV